MKKLTIKEIFKNSFKFAFSDWNAIIILGIILTIASFAQNLNFIDNPILLTLILIVIVVLSLIEMGYSFKIMEETIIEKSTKPPLFIHYKNLLQHGLKDSIVYIFYITLMIIISIMFVYLISLDFDYDILLVVFAMFLIGVMYLVLNVAIINLAAHEGVLKYGFKFRQILNLLRRIGLVRLIFIFIITFLTETLLLISFLYIGTLTDPNIIYLICDLLINPFCILFTERALALSVL